MEPGAAQEPGGRPPAPESVRRQKRRELDARRSKCRIRIGGHLERWCRLKEQLGFALHSQLAQFLLDRYSSHSCTWSTGEPEQLQPAALQRLVVLSHGHGQECGFVPDIQLPAAGSTAAPLVWECVAGHRFSWGGSVVPKSPSCDPAQGCASSPGAGRRRSLRRAALGSKEAGEEETARSPRGDGDRGQEMGDGDDGGTAPQVSLEPGPVAAAGERSLPSSSIPGDDAELGAEAREEEEEDEDFAKGDDLAYTDDLRDENYHPSLDSDSEPQRRQGQPRARRKPIKEEQPLPSPGPLEEKTGRVSHNSSVCPIPSISPAPEPPQMRLEEGPPFLETQSHKLKMGDKILVYEQSWTSQMSRGFSSSPFPRQPRASDKDVAQIGPKRIRKAAKREILLCDFEGCGKIFSNRQYLNHHQKYQHVHQKTFTCSEPTCGKSFNFKKHLKEHEKLHSDKRDYICEFCARSFRTSSNLIIHRRIHTGEKPLQCEICGFTCRQKASLNWHMRKHDADSFYQFPCDICGKRFEKRDNVTAHKSKSHPGGLPQPEGTQQQPPEPPGPVEALELLGAVLGTGGDTGRAPLEFGVGGVGGGSTPRAGEG